MRKTNLLKLSVLACVAGASSIAAPAYAIHCYAVCSIQVPCETTCISDENTMTTCGEYQALNCGGGGSGGGSCPWQPYDNQTMYQEVTNIYYIGNIDGTDYWGCSLFRFFRIWEQNSCSHEIRGYCNPGWEDVPVTGSPDACYAYEFDHGLSCQP